MKGKDVVSYCVMAGLLSPCVTLDVPQGENLQGD